MIAAGHDAFPEVPKIGLRVRLIVRRGHSVDARRPILAGLQIGLPHPFEVDNVVERVQHLSRLSPRQFDYPVPFR